MGFDIIFTPEIKLTLDNFIEFIKKVLDDLYDFLWGKKDEDVE